ncbi:hypothetical protein, partial [Nocardioides sp.]|uniref:hypothetical protein n=1 Tax=Nocardioides sp. TaxID=35761 RepID=UPI00345D7696
AAHNAPAAATRRSRGAPPHPGPAGGGPPRLARGPHAHRIHVLDAGRVVESGTHDELVALDGPYAALWRVQTGDAEDRDLTA